MCRLPVTIITLIFCMTAYAGDSPSGNEQRPIILQANSSKVLPIPPFKAETGPQCDASGNLYFHTGFSAKASVILKIAASDASTTLYRLSDSDEGGTYFVAFYVTSDRKIAMLVGDKRNEPSVYQFGGNDSFTTTQIKLDTPGGVNALTAQGFLLLPNGHILMQGYFDREAPKERRGRGYLAEFAASGKFLRLFLNQPSDETLKSIAGRGAKTSAAQAEDGATYLLEADRVAVLSREGNLEREFKLTPPEFGYVPDLLYMHGRQLVIGFYLSGGFGKAVKGSRYELLDPSSGEIMRIYEPAPELGNNLVCFSDDGLTFMKIENRVVKVLSAAIK